jgi:radical SAM superfamily enzyme YgiQ (UPF0313 family)
MRITMRVLLISPAIMDVVDGRLCVVGVDAVRECPPVGIYGLAAVLQAHGHEVTLADLVLHGTRSIATFADAVDRADLIGIGATSMAWPGAVDVIGQVRSRQPDTPIVCGGVHATLFDRHLLGTFAIQFVLRGEAEASLPRLCDALEGRCALADVANLSWRDARGYVARCQRCRCQTDRPSEL